MTTALAFIALIILVALIFDVANGWHDAANSIATVVSTRVLSPGVAVVWAAVFNFVAFALFGTRVAQTIGGDLIDIERIAERWR
jgi:inorganic phosphate transporter, PiT family